jgi:phosphatidylglycerol:prolipoprotein diacylglycerol transferase
VYGIFISIAILTCTLLVERKVKVAQKDPELLWGAVFVSVVGGVVGARAYHVIDYWELYKENLSLIPAVWLGGLGIIGAVIVGTLVVIVYLKIKKEPILWWIDQGFSVLPLGQSIGRLGNIWNNELLPLAYYEILLNLLLFGVIKLIEKRKGGPGVPTITYVVGYTLIRAALHGLR